MSIFAIMKFIKLIFCFCIFQIAQQLNAQEVKESEFLIYSELYTSKSIHNLAKPSYLCSYDQNNYPSTNIILLKWSSNSNFQNKNSYLRYNIGLMVGDYVNSNLKNEARTLQNIYETNVGIKFSKNMILDFGIFTSHIGFESAIGQESWTCTRSILADNTPYYEAGYRLNYESDNKKWKGNLNFLNGWQKMTANLYDQKSWGHQIQYIPNKKLTLNSSSYFGQSPNIQNRSRYFHNLYSQYQMNDKIGFIVGIDNGCELDKNESLKNARYYYSPIFITKYTINTKSSITGRFEYFKDNNMILNNTYLKEVKGYSINYDYQIEKSSTLRLEARMLQHKESDKIDQKDKNNMFFSVVFCTKINQ